MDISNIISSKTYNHDWDSFLFSIVISLLGAIIGHLRINGSIQMPVILITYKKANSLTDTKSKWYTNLFKLLWLPFDFLLFLIGFRVGNNKEASAIAIELGFLGDMLVGVGTGALAFAAIGLTGSENIYSLMTTALIAGYGGFSYIQSIQEDSFNKNTSNYSDKLDSTEIIDGEHKENNEIPKDIQAAQDEVAVSKNNN